MDIRYAFNLKFDKQNVYLGNIKEKLNSLANYEDLFKLLSELIEHEDYKYLNSFMN